MKKNQLDEYYEKALLLITNNPNLDELITFSSNYFGLEIIVVDVAYHLLACTHLEKYSDPAWENIVKQGSASEEEIVDHYLKDGYLEMISKDNSAIFIDWGICHKHPQASGPIYIDQHLVGFVSVLLKESVEFTIHITNIINKLIGIIIKFNNLDNGYNTIKEMLAEKILNGKNVILNLAKYNDYIHIEPTYMIVHIQSEIESIGMLNHVKSIILERYAEALYFFEKKELYFFIYHMNIDKKNSLYQDLDNIANTSQIFCGCSELFSDINAREIYKEQAKRSLLIGRVMDPKNKVYDFMDYQEENLLYSLLMNNNLKNLLHKSIISLIAFDENNNSNYINTLYVYLKENCDLNKSSSILHLHRNTMVYRIKKIEDIMDVNMNDNADHFIMLMSIKLYDSHKKYMKWKGLAYNK